MVLLFCFGLSGQVLIAEEDFDEMGTSGNMTDGTAWNVTQVLNCDGSGVFESQGDKFRIQNMEGGDCCFCTPGEPLAQCGNNQNIVMFDPIDISAYAGVYVVPEIQFLGDLDCLDEQANQPCPSEPLLNCNGGHDQLQFDYRIDGGAWMNFYFACGDSECLTYNWGCDVNGDEIQIRFIGGNQATDERYFIRKIEIFGFEEVDAEIDFSPNPICEGQDIMFNEIGGDGVSWNWDGPGLSSSMQDPILFNVNSSNEGNYSITVTDVNDCTAEDLVLLSISSPEILFDLPLSDEVCVGSCIEIPIDITGGTGPYTVDMEGSVGILSHNFTFGIEETEEFFTFCLTGGLFPPITDDDPTNTLEVTTTASIFGSGTITILGITDTNGCVGTVDPNPFTISLGEAPDTSDPSPVQACLVNGVATYNLTDIEDDINNDGGLTFSWFEDAGLTNPVSSPYTTAGPETLYVVVDNGECPADPIAIVLMPAEGNDAGMDNTITICNDDDTPVDIFDALNGSPDTGGAWIDEDGAGVSIANPSMVVFEGLAGGDYDFSYNIAANADCPSASATLTVSIIEFADAGTPGGVFLCEGSAMPVNLLSILNGTPDAGGVWSDLTGSGVDISDPTNVDLSGLGVGTYPFLYIVSATDPCTSPASTVTITIDTAPNAGTASSTQICNSGTAVISLENELGPHDLGGNWTDLNTSGVDLSDPNSVSFANVAGGAYQYMYTIPATGSCPEAEQVVTVNVIEGPNAGEATSVSQCEGDMNSFDLFGALGGSPEVGGTWTDLDASGADISDPSQVNLSVLTNGMYDFSYTIMGSGICDDAVAVLTITIEDGANAGSGSSVFLCLSSANADINLFNLLDGIPDMGGVWSDDNASGLDLSDPTSVDFTSLPVGNYNYTYTVAGVGLCPTSSATLEIEINTSPNPGQNALNPICNSGMPIVNLDELLGAHDAGGIWTDDDAVGVDLSDPTTVSFDGVPLGVYDFTYTIPMVGSCPEVSAIINIQITPGPNAGQGSVVQLCQSNNLSIDLEAELTGNPETFGVWIDEDNSGVDISNAGNVDLSGLLPGVYNFIYEVTTAVNCNPDSAIVEITILGSASPGDDVSTSVCIGGDIDLENLLVNNDVVGIFIDPINTGALNGSIVNTSTLTDGQSYVFVHQISGPDNCNMISQATLTITVEGLVTAGANVEGQICPSQDINLVDYLDGADLGGMFLDNDNTGLLSGNIFSAPASGTFNFTYQVGDGIDCPVSFSNLVLEVIEAPVVQFSLATDVCAGACEVLSITAASADIIEGMVLIMTDENGNEEDTQIVFQQSSTFMLPICYTAAGVFSFANLVDAGNYTLSVLPITYEGCVFDLNVNLEITASEESSETRDDELCPGEFVMINGTQYDENNPSGLEIETEANGCETMITIALSFLQEAENNIIESLCNEESVTVNNVLYNQDNPTGQEIIEDAAANGCDSIVNIDLSFDQDFVLETMIDCNDIESSMVSFSSAVVNSAPYDLVIDNNPAIVVNTLPFIFDLSAGVHTILITDVEGCSYTESINIDINAIDIEIVPTTTSDNTFSLSVISNIVIDQYNWSPSDLLSCTDCPNPTATITGTQEILLIATYGSNCEVSDQISLSAIITETENTDVYIPTIFSPNNDGFNDDFMIFTKEATLISTFQVYDRWGNRVFITNNIETNNEAAGWDGKYKTKKLDPGVYTYFAELIFSQSDRRVVKGSITLMR